MFPLRFCSFLTLVSVLLPARAVLSNDVDYLRDVKPVLKKRCYACHGAIKQEGGLRLDTAVAVQKGGDTGAAIDKGTPSQSLLLERVASTDPDERMPPDVIP